ncbi:MAG: DUF3276 family protein [Crocinitomicaceae bacterium]|nr:DUF3276 family protein [Crocinitomicaceae bacterium]
MSVRNDEVYSKAIRAGKRTYFFDVKSTRGNDLYLTITESKKKANDTGKQFYEKHKVFLYKEDFEKFVEGLQHTLDVIKDLKDKGDFTSEEVGSSYQEHKESLLTDVKFEDLA